MKDLQKTSSVSDLIKLTNHPATIVRCFAYWGVIENKDAHLVMQVIRSHKSDIAYIHAIMGDTIEKMTVICYMITQAENYRITLNLNGSEKYEFNDIKKKALYRKKFHCYSK